MASEARTFAIVTGASQGFGRSIAIEFASKCVNGSDLLLVGRNEDGMKQTKQTIINSGTFKGEISIQVTDLADLNNLEKNTQKMMVPSSKQYDRVVLFNNSALLSPLDFMRDLTDLNLLRSNFDLNVTSFIYLSSAFLRFSAQHFPKAQCVIVNISSLAAIKAFSSWGVYCMGKAARNMAMSVIMEEAKANPNHSVKTLNYAPGPMDTEMQTAIRQECKDEGIKKYYTGLKDTNGLVDPFVSARKLISIISANQFESGSHIDFYDK